MKAALLSLFTATVVSPVLLAQEVPPTPEQLSRWSFSAGVSVRQIQVGFDVRGPRAMAFDSLFNTRGSSGRGDVGLMTSPGQVIQYDNGSIGPDVRDPSRGDASFTVSSASQVQFGTMGGGQDFPEGGTVTFNSGRTNYAYNRSFASNGFSTEDNQTAIGPDLKLRYALVAEPVHSVGMSVGWSFYSTSHETGEWTVARQRFVETAKRSTYTYVYDFPTTQAEAPSGFPPGGFDASGFANGAIYDPSLYQGPANAPRKSSGSSMSQRILAALEARTMADLELRTQVLPLLIDYSFQPSERTRVTLAAGPTLNIVHHDLNAETNWYANGRRVLRQQWSDSGTTLKVGATVRASLGMALNEAATWFFDVTGGYDWVPSYDVSAGPVTAEIDLSSWIGTAGFTHLF